MKTNLNINGKKTLQVLNDLIRINIDRISGFEKAAHEEKAAEPHLRETFYRLALEGRAFVNALHAEVIRIGGAPVTHSTITGKIYLRWLESQPAESGTKDPTEEAYNHALKEELPQNLRLLIETQLWALEQSHTALHLPTPTTIPPHTISDA